MGNPFKSLGKKIKHTAKKAKKGAEHVEHGIDHTAKQVAHATDQAVDAVQQGARTAEKEVNNLVDIGHITDEIRNEILGALKSAQTTAISAIKSAEGTATKEIREIGSKLKDEIQRDLKAIEDELAGKVAHEALSDLVDVIRAIAPDEVGIEMGPLTLVIGDLEDKIEHFVKWAEKPPHDRESYIAFVNDVLPQSLTLTENIGFALIIESEDMQFGCYQTWNSDSILANIDSILKKAGIN